MYFEKGDVRISYEVKGYGKPVFLLHGWQMNKETFNSLTRDLSTDFKVYQIDLPGFGKSETKEALNVEKYADILYELINSFEKVPPVILGHSFGGRVGIMYASKYPVDKLILVSTPGIRKKLSIFKRIKQAIYKYQKKIKGSKDYENANKLLRKTLVMAVNLDLKEKLYLIECPTLIIHGSKDKEVKIKIAKEMNKAIKDSELVVISKCGHFPYLERYRYFLIVLRFYLQKDNLC